MIQFKWKNNFKNGIEKKKSDYFNFNFKEGFRYQLRNDLMEIGNIVNVFIIK